MDPRPLAIRSSPSPPVPAEQREKVAEFWRKKKAEIEAIEDFGDREIPMTRLKKVLVAEIAKMTMITFDTPSFMTQASEIFVQELALRAWMSAASHHRAIILDTDVAAAVAATESYDFLKDIVHAFQQEYGSDAPAYKHPLTDEKLLSAGSADADSQQSTSSHLVPPPPPNQAVPQFLHPAAVAPAPFPLSAPGVRHMPILPFPLPFPFRLPLQATPPVMSTAVTSMSTAVTSIPFMTPPMLPPPPAAAADNASFMPPCFGSFGSGIDDDTDVKNMLAASGTAASSLFVDMASSSSNVAAAAVAPALGQPVAAIEEDDDILSAELAAEVAAIMQAYDAAMDSAGNADVKQEQQATTDLDHGQQQEEQQQQEEEEEHAMEMEAVPSLPDLDDAPTPAMSLVELEELLLGDDYDVIWDDVDSWAASFWGDIMEGNPAAAPLPPPPAEDNVDAANAVTTTGPALPPPHTGGDDDMQNDDDPPEEEGEGLGGAGSPTPSPAQEAEAAAPGSPPPAGLVKNVACMSDEQQ